MTNDKLIMTLQGILDEQVDAGIECGCQLAVMRNGVLIADLAAGWTDASQTLKVNAETLFPVFSCGKGVMATAFHMLAERGLLDYDQPVASLWPEYGCQGKEATRIRDVLSHRAGLPRLPKGTHYEQQADWNLMCRRLAAACPVTPPGTRTAYHASTFAWLVGGIAERALGGDFASFIRSELLRPLGIDQEFFFGLPEDLEHRTADIDGSRMEDVNDLRLRINTCQPVRRGFIPSFNGMATARAMARHYASLLGLADNGFRALTDATIAESTKLCRSEDDPINPGSWAKFGLGYVLCGPRGVEGEVFGHGGAAGSEAFACRRTGLAVGFTKNRLSPNHPVHETRDRISQVLGLEARHW